MNKTGAAVPGETGIIPAVPSLRAAAAAFLLLALAGGCLPPDAAVEFRIKDPVELLSFQTHAIPPRGSDFQKGPGEAVTSPIYGRVRFAGLTRFGKYVGMKIEDDLGFWVLTSCLSKIFAAPNQRVTPVTVIGREGSNCGLGTGGPGVSHTHITIHLPPFAREFGKPGGKYTAQNGIEYLIADPDKYAQGAKKLGYFLADYTDQSALVDEATKRLDRMGRDFRNTHLGWFLNRTRKRRPFLRAMVMYRMWQTGILNPAARKRAEEYLRWHAAIRIPVYLPYPNPELVLAYEKPNLKPKTPDDIERLWEKTVTPILDRGVDREGILKAILEFRKKSPIQGEAGTALHLGITYSTMGRYADAVEEMLIADALSEVHSWNTPGQVRKFKYLVADLLMKAYWGAGEIDFAGAFKSKREKYRRWRNVPW